MAEKEINEISRDARVLFNKANEAAQRENLDYAIALYNQVLEKEPGFFECRKALRELQFKKAGGGGGFFKKMLSGASSSPLVAKGQIAMRNNPASALAIAEQILNSDPNSSAGHRLVVASRAGAGTAAHRHHVPGNSGEKFAQGQKSGHRIRRCPLRQWRRHQAGGKNPRRTARAIRPTTAN